MSFSVNTKGKTKAAALAKFETEFANVQAQQPAHKKDSNEVFNAVDAHLNLIAEPAENEVVALSVNGSVTWRGTESEPKFTQASININAWLTAAPVQE